MKKILLIVLVLSGLYDSAFAQRPLPGQKPLPKSKPSPERIITTVEHGKPVTYDLQNDQDVEKLLNNLMNVPGISKDVKNILQYNKITLDLITKIHERTNNEGLLIKEIFFRELERYIRENERLRLDNEQLLKQTTDPEFSQALDSANTMLTLFDNEGYQQVLETFKETRKKRVAKQQKEIAEAASLQAENNLINFKFDEALTQINEALALNNKNSSFWILKGKIASELYNIDTAIIAYENSLTFEIDSMTMARVWNDLGTVYYQKGDYDEAIMYYNKALEADQRLLGIDHTYTASDYNNIGVSYFAKEDHNKALIYYNKALEINKKILGLEHPNIASGYNNVGAVYSEIGAHVKAIEYYAIALTIDKNALGLEHPNTAIDHNNIGAAFANKGDYDRAIEYFNKALVSNEKKFGPKHPLIATGYANIGSAYHHQGEYNKAIEFYIKSLAIHEQVLGLKHWRTISDYKNIGTVYNLKGEYDKAIEYFTKALIINEKDPAIKEQNIASEYNNLGTLYYQKGEYDKAIEHFKKSLTINERVVGLEDSSTAFDYYCLGLAYMNKGEYDKSIENHNKALTINEKIFGVNHPKTATNYNNLGLVYSYNGKYEKAIEYFKRALGLREILGNNHPLIQAAVINLFASLVSKEQIEPTLSEVAQNYLAGYTDVEKANFFNVMGGVLFKKNQYKTALNFYQLALNHLDAGQVDSSEIIWAAVYQNIAKVHCYLGNKSAAQPLFKKALQYCQGSGNEKQEIKKKIHSNLEECKLRH